MLSLITNTVKYTMHVIPEDEFSCILTFLLAAPHISTFLKKNLSPNTKPDEEEARSFISFKNIHQKDYIFIRNSEAYHSRLYESVKTLRFYHKTP